MTKKATTNDVELNKSDTWGLITFLLVIVLGIGIVIYLAVFHPTRERFAFGDNVLCTFSDGNIKGVAVAEAKKHLMVDEGNDTRRWLVKEACEKVSIPPTMYWANSGAIESTVRNKWSD